MNEIVNVLDPKIIELNIDAKNKKEAITELSKKLKEANYIDDIDAFIEDIYIRESEAITGIGDGIAIPHGKSSYVSSVGVAIGILKNGIEWESLDDEPVKIVILFAVSDDNKAARNQLKLLSLFAGRLGNNEVVKKLKMAKTKEDVINSFTEGSVVS